MSTSALNVHGPTLRKGVDMDLVIGKHYIDNDETPYKCIAIKQAEGYSEAVMELVGSPEFGTLFYAIFYRSNWAWLDRENPDFRLVEEIEFFPQGVPNIEN